MTCLRGEADQNRDIREIVDRGMMQFFTTTQPYFASHFHFSANGIFMASVHLSLRDGERKRDRSLTVITANRFFGQNYWGNRRVCNIFKTNVYGRVFGKAQPFLVGHTAADAGHLCLSPNRYLEKHHYQRGCQPRNRHHQLKPGNRNR
jgi:hypothetical protein